MLTVGAPVAPPPRIRVVAAVIERDGTFLITQRRPEAVLPLLWEFPGGKVEPLETDEQALMREVKTRLLVDIKVGHLLSATEHEYERYAVTLAIYSASISSGEPRSGHIHDYRWVPASDFDCYEFPPADQATMDQLLAE
jgi:8-oxo-dGTP diphosphatase